MHWRQARASVAAFCAGHGHAMAAISTVIPTAGSAVVPEACLICRRGEADIAFARRAAPDLVAAIQRVVTEHPIDGPDLPGDYWCIPCGSTLGGASVFATRHHATLHIIERLAISYEERLSTDSGTVLA